MAGWPDDSRKTEQQIYRTTERQNSRSTKLQDYRTTEWQNNIKKDRQTINTLLLTKLFQKVYSHHIISWFDPQSFCHSVVLSFCRSAVLSFCRSVDLSFCHSCVFPPNHLSLLLIERLIPTNVGPWQIRLILQSLDVVDVKVLNNCESFIFCQPAFIDPHKIVAMVVFPVPM